MKLGGKLIETNDIKSRFEQKYFYEEPFLVIPGGSDVLHNNEGLPYAFFMEEEFQNLNQLMTTLLVIVKFWEF